MKMIKFVGQAAGSVDCVLACIAMVSDFTLEKLKRTFPVSEKGLDALDEQVILKKLGIPFIQYQHPATYYGRVYLLTVPSLNIVGGNHRIIFDCRYVTPRIYDPNECNGNKFYGEGGEPLNCYTEAMELPAFSECLMITEED